MTRGQQVTVCALILPAHLCTTLTHALPFCLLPPGPCTLQPQYDMATALIEAKQVMTGAVGELLAKTGERHSLSNSISWLILKPSCAAQLGAPAVHMRSRFSTLHFEGGPRSPHVQPSWLSHVLSTVLLLLPRTPTLFLSCDQVFVRVTLTFL
jgi:hypothetical protein